MSKIRVALTLCLSWSALEAQQPVPQGTHRADPGAVRHTVDSLAKAFIANREAPAVSIVVVRGRDTLVSEGYGLIDLENAVAATPHSVYRIGSITKQFTSAAVMQQVEAGKVRLDDSIGTYLPSLPVRWRGVTVRQLLNHTSGILGMLVEKVTGKSYAQYLKERVFAPAGLTETMYCSNAPIIPHRAQGYGK